MSYDYTFKVITGGPGGVGKTTMLHRYIEGKFDANTRMTIGVEIFDKRIEHAGKKISLQLWDFGGQERFRFFLDSFVMGASGAFLMFDLTNYNSFESLKDWMGIVRKDNPTIPIVLLGSKFDLTESICVEEESIKQFMEKNNISTFIKVSSKTGFNVEEAFHSLVNLIIEVKQLKISQEAEA